jgi:flagellar protein FlbD
VISVTRLDGTAMIVNTDQIAWIEYIPDTVISLMNGEKLIVREAPEVIVDRVKEFRRALVPGPATARQPVAGRSVAGMSVVDASAAGGGR